MLHNIKPLPPPVHYLSPKEAVQKASCTGMPQLELLCIDSLPNALSPLQHYTQPRQAVDHLRTGSKGNAIMQLPLLGCRWAVFGDIKTLLQPALFEGGIRGLAATTDLPAGSEAVRVPQAALISHDTARQSDLVGSLLTTVNVALTTSHTCCCLGCSHTQPGSHNDGSAVTQLMQAPSHKPAHAETMLVWRW